MSSFKKLSQSGDTIIEVMLSMSLLTMFLFLSWGITNKATQIGMNSRKRVEVVNSMKEQAEIIKAQYNNQSFGIDELIKSVQPTVIGLDTNSCSNEGVAKDTIFHFDYLEDKLQKKFEKKKTPDTENTVWVQLKPGAGTEPKYYDFYIRACWQTVGSIQNTDSSQFIVRLNSGDLSSVVVTPPSDTIIEDSGTTTLAYEDFRNSVDRDYNDFIATMNVVERYKNDYLENITIQYTPKIRDACFDHQLVLVFDGIVDGGVNNNGPNGSKGFNSLPMFDGNASISYQLTTDGVAGTPQVIPKTSNLNVFMSTVNSLSSAGAARQTAKITITGFDPIASNKKAARGSFNIKRYRTLLRVPSQNVNTPPTCNISTPGEDIDLVDIHSNMFDNNAANPYPLAFFVPVNWAWPSSGQNIDSKYNNFKYHAQYLNALRTNPNAVEDARGTNWYE